MERTHDARAIRATVVLALVALAVTQLACDALGTLGGGFAVRERIGFVEEFRRAYEEAQRQAALGKKAVPAGVARRRWKRCLPSTRNGGGPG